MISNCHQAPVFVHFINGQQSWTCFVCNEKCNLMEKTWSMPRGFKSRLKHLIERQEDYREKPYVDTEGHVTIGYGYNLTDRGLPKGFLDWQLDEDVEWCYDRLHTFRWFPLLANAQQAALVSMCYNLGWKKFNTFVKMIDAFDREDYTLAAEEMLDSKWAKQVGNRARVLSTMVETKEFPDGY